MALLKSANYGPSRDSGLRCAGSQERSNKEVLAVGRGKGFPFPEEHKSNFSSAKSSYGSINGRTQYRCSGIHRHVIENTIHISISGWALRSSTLVDGVQLGICIQSTTSSPKWQKLLQGLCFKGLDGLPGTYVTQRAKL
jgi:hypothetical protein